MGFWLNRAQIRYNQSRLRHCVTTIESWRKNHLFWSVNTILAACIELSPITKMPLCVCAGNVSFGFMLLKHFFQTTVSITFTGTLYIVQVSAHNHHPLPARWFFPRGPKPAATTYHWHAGLRGRKRSVLRVPHSLRQFVHWCSIIKSSVFAVRGAPCVALFPTWVHVLWWIHQSLASFLPSNLNSTDAKLTSGSVKFLPLS